MRRLVSIVGVVIAAALWWSLILGHLPYVWEVAVMLGAMPVMLPFGYVCRRLLDARPTVERAHWVTTWLHAVLVTGVGAAVIAAVRVAQHTPGWRLPVPLPVGLVLTVLTGAMMALVALNLAARGLGAPFAIQLTRRLAVEGFYAWTRNPMVLVAVSFMVSLSLWMQSAVLLAWVLLELLPLMLLFIKYYEERELEIRFGPSYLEYKARTPLLWPRRPK